jgi:WD40 repeat protein
MKILKAHPKSVIGLAFSPDGRYLTSASNDGSVSVHDAANDYQTHPLKPASKGLPTYCNRVAFTAGGRCLIGFNAKAGLDVWDVPGWSLRATFLAGQLTGSTSMACSPAGPFLLATSFAVTGTCSHVWILPDFQEAELWPGNPVHPVAFDPGGTRLACGDGTVREFPSGREIRRLDYRRESALHWGGGARPLLAAVYARSAHVFDPDTGEEVARLRMDRMDFLASAFTPDGRAFITVSNERTAKVWDTASWRVRETLDWRVGKLKSVAVSPDGMRAATGSERGRVVVWDLE